jgi:hypothetical protein
VPDGAGSSLLVPNPVIPAICSTLALSPPIGATSVR